MYQDLGLGLGISLLAVTTSLTSVVTEKHQDVKLSLPLPEKSGWMHQEDGCYATDWDSIELQERVKGTAQL